MTTIAYRDGVMAADSACFNEGLYEGEVDKIWPLSDVGLLGCCGEYGAILKVVEWLKAGGEPKLKPRLSRESEFAGLLVKREGEVMHYQIGLRPLCIMAEFHAIGSGRQIAIGAMAAGASAEEAVQIACRYDRISMEPVRTRMIDTSMG
jgi:ATP-dependent HslUV protease subunit HslV